MSDYAKTTNFTAKDALTTGDPEKVILGADVDQEFDNIQTAVATKVDKTGATMTGDLVMSSASIDEAKGSDIASASSIDLGAATGNFVDITGTTTITSLGTAQAGIYREVRFTGSLTLTYNATSLVLPGDVNIITQAGDIAKFRSLGSGNWICTNYQRDTKVRGAFAYATSSASMTSGTWTTMSFASTVYDTDSIHSGSNFTVPSGVTKVKIITQVTINDNATGIRGVRVLEDGSSNYAGRGILYVPAVPLSLVGTPVQVMTPVIEVSGGEVFTVQAYQNSGSTIGNDFSSSETWCMMEIIE